jgi:hypothetical protein
VYFWKKSYPLVQRFCRENRVSVNRLVNEAVLAFLKASDDGYGNGEMLRLLAEKALLKREERELKDDWRVIGRSGSYLPSYVDKIVKPKDSPFRMGQVPLRALSANEEDVFLRIAARRDQIARRLVEIDRVLLPKKRFRLEHSTGTSRSRARDRNKSHGPWEERDGNG